MFEPLELAVAAVTMFVGATVMTTVGFGIGLTTAPVLLLVLDPLSVVLLVNTVSLALFVLIIVQTRRYLPVRAMIPILVAGLLGVPFGVLVLRFADPAALRIAIASVILVVTAALVFNRGKATSLPRAAGPVIGFVVAAMITAFTIGGPLLILYVLGLDWTRHTVRASMSLYFLIVQGVSVAGYGVAGMYTAERATLIVVATLPVLAGFGLATLIVRRIDERRFRQAVVAVIVVTSVVVLGREAVAL